LVRQTRFACSLRQTRAQNPMEMKTVWKATTVRTPVAFRYLRKTLRRTDSTCFPFSESASSSIRLCPLYLTLKVLTFTRTLFFRRQFLGCTHGRVTGHRLHVLNRLRRRQPTPPGERNPRERRVLARKMERWNPYSYPRIQQGAASERRDLGVSENSWR
jgi:hypothetical protein